MNCKPTIIFLGLNEIGKKVYDWMIKEGENILCLITHQNQLNLIEKLEPDIVIAGGFRFLVPKKYLKIPEKGCINMHKSYLPYNRGANPNVWSILEDNPAGVSIHYMDDGIDTGPIIAQKEVEIKFDDTAKDLYEKLQEEQFELFKKVWPKIKNNDIDIEEQKCKGTFHEKEDFKDLWKLDLDAEYTVENFINLLKALTFPPFKNAYVEKNNKKYFLELIIEPDDKINNNKDDRYIPNYND